MGGLPGRLPRRMAEAARRLLPHPGLAVVRTERRPVPIHLVGRKLLEGFRHLAVEEPASRRQKLGDGDVPDALVGHIEVLT